MKGETCASSIVEDLLDEFRRGTGLHRKVNLGARLKMDFQYMLLGYDYAYFILFYHVRLGLSLTDSLNILCKIS